MNSNCKEICTYEELLIKNGANIGYGDLLMTSEWCMKRREIIKRDHIITAIDNQEDRRVMISFITRILDGLHQLSLLKTANFL